MLLDTDYNELLQKMKYGLPHPDTQYHVAIVGAGMAGLTAAKLLRDAGHEVATVDFWKQIQMVTDDDDDKTVLKISNNSSNTVSSSSCRRNNSDFIQRVDWLVDQLILYIVKYNDVSGWLIKHIAMCTLVNVNDTMI